MVCNELQELQTNVLGQLRRRKVGLGADAQHEVGLLIDVFRCPSESINGWITRLSRLQARTGFLHDAEAIACSTLCDQGLDGNVCFRPIAPRSFPCRTRAFAV